MRRSSRATGPKARCQFLITLRQLPTIQGTVKELQGSNGLVERNLVTGLVNTGEREVAVFAGFAVLDTINEEGLIASSLELLAVLVLCGEGDGLATEPVADVVCVTVDEGNADGAGEDVLEIFDEIGPDEVTGLLEGKIDFVVGASVVEVDADGIHDRVLGKVLLIVARRSRVIIGVTNVIDTPAAEIIVGTL